MPSALVPSGSEELPHTTSLSSDTAHASSHKSKRAHKTSSESLSADQSQDGVPVDAEDPGSALSSPPTTPVLNAIGAELQPMLDSLKAEHAAAQAAASIKAAQTAASLKRSELERIAREALQYSRALLFTNTPVYSQEGPLDQWLASNLPDPVSAIRETLKRSPPPSGSQPR